MMADYQLHRPRLSDFGLTVDKVEKFRQSPTYRFGHSVVGIVRAGVRSMTGHANSTDSDSQKYVRYQAALHDYERLLAERHIAEANREQLVPEGRPSAKPERQAIPQSVRREVWRRDEAKCCQCGGRERLEFDHIIPVAKGGSNTARNIELLCEECNRRKSAGL